MRRFVAEARGVRLHLLRFTAFSYWRSPLSAAIFCTNESDSASWASHLSVITDLSAYIQDGAEVTPSSVEGRRCTRCAGWRAAGAGCAQWVNVPALNVLLLGTDARPDEADVPRTDTMILASLDPQSQSLGLLSLHDLWLPIPGWVFQQDQHGVPTRRDRRLSGRQAWCKGYGEQLHRSAGAVFCARELPGVRRIGRSDRRRGCGRAGDDP